MDIRFESRSAVREFASQHGLDRLEEELDSGRLDLRSTLLVEQWLDDEPLRARRRRQRTLRRIWDALAYGVWFLGAVGLAWILWSYLR
jgi:hypothetical protein